MENWQGFNKGDWSEKVDVSNFIQLNYTPYTGNESFLADSTTKTKELWDKAEAMIKDEIKTGKVDIDVDKFSSIDGYDAGYLDKSSELIVGYQTDSPLKRIVNPYGGYRMVTDSLDAYGFEMNKELETSFNSFRKRI